MTNVVVAAPFTFVVAQDSFTTSERGKLWTAMEEVPAREMVAMEEVKGKEKVGMEEVPALEEGSATEEVPTPGYKCCDFVKL